MKKFLVVVDMQNDFIDGALGTKEAQAIVPAAVKKIGSYEPDCIFATRDTHGDGYLETQEGKNLPVPHCIRGTKGREVRSEVAQAMPIKPKLHLPLKNMTTTTSRVPNVRVNSILILITSIIHNHNSYIVHCFYFTGKINVILSIKFLG